MNFQRGSARFILGGAALLALSVGLVSLRQLGGLNPTAWATVAAVLAVIAAVVSAWTGQRLVELQDVNGDIHSRQLMVSGEHERRALLHQSEEPKTMYELQKLPDKLDAIAKELQQLRKAVGHPDDEVSLP